jgi:hypothetical protein
MIKVSLGFIPLFFGQSINDQSKIIITCHKKRIKPQLANKMIKSSGEGLFK